jgi:hypothetical protein
VPERPWQQAPPPTGDHCWSWAPDGLEDLPRVRREFQAHLTGPELGELDTDRVRECVLALDELMSNGLRHGRAPVEVEVCSVRGGLLLMVSDRAADEPPRPTSTRDPGQGGMGLGMIASASVACGWEPETDLKTVWAVMPTDEVSAA